jgi:restriction endonuclease S subunit
MSITYKYIKLIDHFNLKRGKVLSNDYINNNKGEFPVYSSATENNGCIGHIDTFMFEGEYLTWTTDGIYAGTVFYRNGRFNCTNVCGILELKNNKESSISQIQLEYISCVLDFKSIAKGFDNKKVMINQITEANMTLKIPVNNYGDFDLDKQKEIISKYKKIEEIKSDLTYKLSLFKKMDITPKSIQKTKAFKFEDIFKLGKGSGNNQFKPAFFINNSNLGDIPVFGAVNKKETTKGYINNNIKGIKYYQDCIRVGIDGNGGAGISFYQEGVFAINHKVRCLILDDKYKNLLSYQYIQMLIRNIQQELSLGNSNGLSVKKLKNIVIEIPIKEDGNIDLKKQQEIYKIFEKTNEIKRHIEEKLQHISQLEVDVFI